MFGKLMRVPDAAMAHLLRAAAGRARAGAVRPSRRSGAWQGASPSASTGPTRAEAAERHFDRLHKEHLPPEEMEEAVLNAAPDGGGAPPAVLAEHFGLSRSEARRLLGQGGVRLNGEALGESDLDVDAERLQDGVLQVGRRRFKRIRVAS